MAISEGSSSHRLIRGVLRMNVAPLNIERVELARTAAWTVSIVDTGDGAAWTPEGDTTMHILWQADEDDAMVAIGDERYPIVPGDTMGVPGGTTLHLSAGMLLVRIEAASRTLDRVRSPSHGVETFEGYNRRTGYDTPDSYTLERWKITQPLRVSSTGSPYAIIDLADPLALVWSGGTDLIGRGECRMLSREAGDATLLPDGLGYALIVR